MTRGPVRVAIVGAGSRGADVYGRGLEGRSDARVVAVADPDPLRRDRLAERHGVPAAGRFAGALELLSGPRIADLAIVATPDADHVQPALLALRRGYDVLLEKPIAPDAEGVEALATAAADATGNVTVAHVLRHTPFFRTIRDAMAQGRIGRPIGIDHVENVGHWHFAHSYVRGAWRREDLASPMILAKACHDLDLVRWLADAPWDEVVSRGERRWFREEHAPAGAPAFCLDGCPVETTCPYSAPRIYLGRFAGTRGWPRSVVAPGGGDDAVAAALRAGPYGRCVYRCDNDVADHQVATLRFANGLVATLTVTAFSEENTRTIRVFGSHGELEGHLESGRITLRDFVSGGTERLDTPPADGHAHADRALLDDVIARLHGEAGPGPTDLATSVESHLMAFAAERSRHEAVAVGPAEVRGQRGPSTP